MNKILIVDDEASVRNTLRDIFKCEGYEVITAGSAIAALQEGQRNNFDLLIADIKMPEMDGLELVRRFRELNPATVSIIITGYPSFETISTAFEQGVVDYIIKPYDKAEICAAVAIALKKTAASNGNLY